MVVIRLENPKSMLLTIMTILGTKVLVPRTERSTSIDISPSRVSLFNYSLIDITSRVSRVRRRCLSSSGNVVIIEMSVMVSVSTTVFVYERRED